MKRSRISAVIAGSALSVGGLALAPAVDGVAEARSSSGVCFRVVGAGHHYAVVAYPCPQYKRHFKQLPVASVLHIA